MGDIIPIKRKKEVAVDPDLAEEVKEASKLLPSNDEESQRGDKNSIPDFKSSITDEEKKDLLSKFELIQTRRITYDKPILIIYNPSSGRHTNLIPLIESRLTKEKIPFEFKRT
jgi:hypothetical protein